MWKLRRQVWVDPQNRDAHRAPAFRRWLDQRGLPALIRYSERDGFVLFPPSASKGHGWVKHQSGLTTERSHTMQQKAEAVGGELVIEEAPAGGVRRATLASAGAPSRWR